MALFSNPINRDYYVVVQPYPDLGYSKRRWLTYPDRLQNYIGAYNANTAFLKASKMRTDKIRLKFRSFGIVDIYLK